MSTEQFCWGEGWGSVWGTKEEETEGGMGSETQNWWDLRAESGM